MHHTDHNAHTGGFTCAPALLRAASKRKWNAIPPLLYSAAIVAVLIAVRLYCMHR
jgi:hypothetical protein